MKTSVKILPLAALLCWNVLSSCSKSDKSINDYESSSADSVSTFTPEISADSVAELPIEKRAFVKTAYFRGEVKDVKVVSQQLTNWVKQMKGFVEQNELKSDIIREVETPIGDDSLRLNKIFVLQNYLVLKIPTVYLDSLMYLVQAKMAYIDIQNTNASDVSRQLLASQLRKARFNHFENRYQKKLNQPSSKLNDKLSGEENLFDIQTQADDNALSTLQLKDQVAISTVEVHLYQQAQLASSIVPDMNNKFAFRPSFWQKLTISLQTGWYVFIDVLLGLLNLWMLLVLGGVGFWIYKKYKVSA